MKHLKKTRIPRALRINKTNANSQKCFSPSQTISGKHTMTFPNKATPTTRQFQNQPNKTAASQLQDTYYPKKSLLSLACDANRTERAVRS